mgnify:CR=1 FL=1
MSTRCSMYDLVRTTAATAATPAGSLRYYATLGRQAYARLASALERDKKVATGVFTELADRFREFADLLAEIERVALTLDKTPIELRISRCITNKHHNENIIF